MLRKHSLLSYPSVGDQRSLISRPNITKAWCWVFQTRVCVCPCTRTMEMSGQTYRRRNGERSAALGGSWHLLFGERNAGTCRERAEGSASWPASLGLVSHPVLITIHTTQHQMARCLTKCSMSYRKVPVSESWGHHSPTLKTTAGEAAPI